MVSVTHDKYVATEERRMSRCPRQRRGGCHGAKDRTYREDTLAVAGQRGVEALGEDDCCACLVDHALNLRHLDANDAARCGSRDHEATLHLMANRQKQSERTKIIKFGDKN